MSNSAFTPTNLSDSKASARLVLADGSNPTVSSASAIDVPGVTLTITLTRSARLGFCWTASIRNNTAGQTTQLNIQVNGVNQFGANGIFNTHDTNSYFYNMCLSGISDILSAGTYIVKARWFVSGGTATLLADSNNSTHLAAWEI